MSGEKNTSLVTAKPQPPSISIVVSFQPRPGCSGHAIVSRATVSNQGTEHELRSRPDCTYALTPPRSLSITVWLRGSDGETD